MAAILVVSSKVKEYMRAQGCNSSADVAEALTKHVEQALDAAVKRAKSNGRKTVRGSDL